MSGFMHSLQLLAWQARSSSSLRFFSSISVVQYSRPWIARALCDFNVVGGGHRMRGRVGLQGFFLSHRFLGICIWYQSSCHGVIEVCTGNER